MISERYQRQLSLPDIGQAQQEALARVRVLVVGAGGLGSVVLPYLAGAGAGHITIIDSDTVSISNLHRQVIYQDQEVGCGKAASAALCISELNPDIEVQFFNERLEDGFDVSGYNLVIDGSDNFETKVLINRLSVENSVPLISASVNQFAGQVGVFAGYAAGQPCYSCMFPELPSDARNCNEAGVLGTSVGITGMWQSHLALMFLLGIGDVEPGMFLTIDSKTMRMKKLSVPKSADCSVCKDGQAEWILEKEENKMAELLSMEELSKRAHIIVDVRSAEEIVVDPIEGAVHMELGSVPSRYGELPGDKLCAFVCAGNVRSVQAAEYLQAQGVGNVCVLDKFSI